MRLHPGDLGGLIDVDVVGELEDGLVLRGAGRAEQLLHHGHGAPVVLDHVGQEEPVELRAPWPLQLLHLRLGQHAGHEHRVAVHRIAWRRLGHRLSAVAGATLHGGDLVLLRVDDPLGQPEDRGAGAVRGAKPAMTSAWAWWPIMPDMKRTSASV